MLDVFRHKNSSDFDFKKSMRCALQKKNTAIEKFVTKKFFEILYFRKQTVQNFRRLI